MKVGDKARVVADELTLRSCAAWRKGGSKFGVQTGDVVVVLERMGADLYGVVVDGSDCVTPVCCHASELESL